LLVAADWAKMLLPAAEREKRRHMSRWRAWRSEHGQRKRAHELRR
jgi:hypothetical protein